MALTLILILFGAGLGGLLSGLLGLYFVATRAYRRAGKKLIIGFGRILTIVASVGSVLLLTRGLGALGVRQHSTQANVGLYAYTASFVCGVFPDRAERNQMAKVSWPSRQDPAADKT